MWYETVIDSDVHVLKDNTENVNYFRKACR